MKNETLDQAVINNKVEIDTIAYYGDSKTVKKIQKTDYNDFLVQEKRTQILRNFDNSYDDIVDYIVKITHKIWEEKSIGLIYQTYHNNVAMHFGSFSVYGIQSVVSGTLQTLFSFPDRKLITQDVIWSEHGSGYLSSHRIQSIATNLNDSNFGPATNKKINFRTTVDCAVEDNRIYEEWLVRDNLWICEQLGYDPHQLAKKMAFNSYLNGEDMSIKIGLDENMIGQKKPVVYKAKDTSIGEYVLEMMNNIYNCRLFEQVKKYYYENAVVHYICNKDLTGHFQIQGMLINLFASFPNAHFYVDRVTCNANESLEESYIAVRWRLSGLHEGIGQFGKPSNNKVEIMGITHYTFYKRKIVEEWITYDGLDVLKQIYSNSQNDLNL